MKNNAINIPYLDKFGYILIGTGTTPVIGPILGTMSVVVDSSGTAITVSSTSTLVNGLGTNSWGAMNQDQIPCQNITFCSSVFGVFDGSVSKIATYWETVTPSSGNTFILSMWASDETTKIAETLPFVPVLGVNVTEF